MKNSLRLSSAVLFLGAAVFCSSSAFATQSVITNDQVDAKVKSMTPEQRQEAAQNAQNKYSSLTPEQQQKLKNQEKVRLNKIHTTNQENRQES